MIAFEKHEGGVEEEEQESDPMVTICKWCRSNGQCQRSRLGASVQVKTLLQIFKILLQISEFSSQTCKSK
jgi:hypothetical protein